MAIYIAYPLDIFGYEAHHIYIYILYIYISVFQPVYAPLSRLANRIIYHIDVAMPHIYIYIYKYGDISRVIYI